MGPSAAEAKQGKTVRAPFMDIAGSFPDKVQHCEVSKDGCVYETV